MEIFFFILRRKIRLYKYTHKFTHNQKSYSEQKYFVTLLLHSEELHSCTLCPCLFELVWIVPIPAQGFLILGQIFMLDSNCPTFSKFSPWWKGPRRGELIGELHLCFKRWPCHLHCETPELKISVLWKFVIYISKVAYLLKFWAKTLIDHQTFESLRTSKAIHSVL